MPAPVIPAAIAGILRILALGGKQVAKNVPRGGRVGQTSTMPRDPRLLGGGMRTVGEGTTGTGPAYQPATVRTNAPPPGVGRQVAPSPFRVGMLGGPEVAFEDQPAEPAVAPGNDRLPPITKTKNVEPVPYPDSVPLVSPEAAPAQPAAPARVIVPQTRDEQLEAYENFGKNIPGTIDIGAQSFKIAGPSDIGQRATVPIPGAGAEQMRPAAAGAQLAAPGSAGIASEVTRRLGLTPNDGASGGPVPKALMSVAAPAAAAPAQDGDSFFSNLFKGGILDSESPLSRQQRVMLGVAALKDAGNALEGKATNFFGETQKSITEASQPDYGTPSNQRLAIQQYTEAMNRALIQTAGSPAQKRALAEAGAYVQFIPPEARRQIDANYGTLLGGERQPAQAAPSEQEQTEAKDFEFDITNPGVAEDVILGLGEGQFAIPEDLSKALRVVGGTVAERGSDAYADFAGNAQKMQQKIETQKATMVRAFGKAASQLPKLVAAYKTTEDKDFNTGITAQVLRNFKWSPSGDLAAQVETIKAVIGLSELEALKASGTSLGQVAIFELQQLQRSLGNLETTQTKEGFQREMRNVIRHYVNAMDKYMTGEPDETAAQKRQREYLIGGRKAPDELKEARRIMGGLAPSDQDSGTGDDKITHVYKDGKLVPKSN